MRKIWLSLALVFLLSALTIGCGSNLSTSSGTRGFSNPDSARGLILTLLSILDGLRPLGVGPSASGYVNRVCPFDSEHFDAYYNATVTAATDTTTVSFYTTSANAHYILLGSSANKCSTVLTIATGGYDINLNGKSSSQHSPEMSFAADAAGTSGSIDGNILIAYSANDDNLASGAVLESFSGSDVHIFLTIYENNAYGGTGQMILEYQPSAFAAHVISGKNGVGRLTISGTTSFNGEYFFNTDYSFDANFARIS